MTVPVFIGDEVTAAAYRLVGLRTHVIENGAVLGAFEQACDDADLLLITAACVSELGSDRLDAAMRRGKPLIVIVPDAARRTMPPDLDKEVERVLGIEQ